MKNTNFYLTRFDAQNAAQELAAELKVNNTPCQVNEKSWDCEFNRVDDTAEKVLGNSCGEFPAFFVEGAETYGVFAYAYDTEELVEGAIFRYRRTSADPQRVGGDLCKEVARKWDESKRHKKMERDNSCEFCDLCEELELPDDGAENIYICDEVVIALARDLNVDWERWREDYADACDKVANAAACWNADPFCVEGESIREVAQFIIRDDVCCGETTAEDVDADIWEVLCRSVDLTPEQCEKIRTFQRAGTCEVLTICYEEDMR